MWLELARPVTLLGTILSLLMLLRTAFLGPEIDFGDRVFNTLCVLVVAAGCAFLSGLTFPERDPLDDIPWYDRRFYAERMRSTDPILRLYRSFPVQIFCWTTAVLFVLFVIDWYLQTYFMPYRNIYW